MAFDLPLPQQTETLPLPEEKELSDLQLYEKAIQKTRELLADSGLTESDPKAKNLYKKIAETLIAGKPGSQGVRITDTV